MRNLFKRFINWINHDDFAFDAEYAVQHDRVNEGLPPVDESNN
jgi:hypothetical protein